MGVSDVEMIRVSSHAPVRGHPPSRWMPLHGAGCFKSCPREGASDYRARWRAIDKGFKSCPREGASISVFATDMVRVFQVRPP